MISQESRRMAGILLVVLPTVIYGGVSLLTFLQNKESGYMDNPLRQNLFRAGHAHAGVLLVLSLVYFGTSMKPNCPGVGNNLFGRQSLRQQYSSLPDFSFRSS